MSLKLHTIIASTRPSRVGPAVAEWFHNAAKAHGGFDASLVDLASFNLPVFDEPEHPRTGHYHHAHTKAWSASVKSADAFVFVTPEYNYGPPPSLINALTYLSAEWAYKPAAFVSYAFVSGGTRAVQATKPWLTTLKMMPIPEGVAIPNFPAFFDADKKFVPNELVAAGVKPTLDELARWATALKTLR